MPAIFHPHDTKWISDQLSKASSAAREKAVEGYETVYRSALDDEPVEHKKENAARREANTRLRVFIEKISNR